jgi:tRNA threonylcarbamoyladenosine biosynthesis protein TsaE
MSTRKTLKRFTRSKKETIALAKKLAQQVVEKGASRKGALILALTGELGAGKTTFLQGFAEALGIKEKILSPTFIILKKFALPRDAGFSNFYHIDCYRIKRAGELFKLGLKEILGKPGNIIAIEWAEKIERRLPKRDIIFIKIRAKKKGKEREIIIQTLDK